MIRFKYKNILLISAILALLLLQSFTLWHDAEHAFHYSDSQCERYEAFNHSHPLNTVNSIPSLYISRFVVETVSVTDVNVFSRQYDANTIRAPPHLI